VSAYDEAVSALYQAELGDFVAARKRLAAELKAAGDKDGAGRLLKLGRPPVSAWAVNQLWWREREAFEAFVKAAASVKLGDREASQRHREALAELRERATQILLDGGNGASEQTLRRVTTTLGALAATGGFQPDAPGALSADRDPPGFEALGFGAAAAPAATTTKATAATAAGASHAGAEAAARRAEQAAARRAEEEERTRRLAERQSLSQALREAQALRETQQRELTRLRAELETGEQALKQTQTLLAELEQKLADL